MPTWLPRVLRLLWWGLLLVWTYGLLTPAPFPETKKELGDWPAFVWSKALHVSAYAFLAATAAGVRPRGRGWFLLLALLVGHGALTEFLQTFVPNRVGCVRDVLLDWLGIALGTAVAWPWSRRAAVPSIVGSEGRVGGEDDARHLSTPQPEFQH